VVQWPHPGVKYGKRDERYIEDIAELYPQSGLTIRIDEPSPILHSISNE
jgi:hypothetical protein